MVSVSELDIDWAYQRQPKASWVEAHRPFDPDKAGAIKVSARGGKLYVVDGQGRRLIAEADGIKSIAAYVMTGLTQKDEADMFVGAQQDSRRLTAHDLWHADLTRRDERVMRIQTVIDNLHFKTGDTYQHGPDTISALQALRYVELHHGIDILANTLRLIRERWLTLDKALTGQTIKGLAAFIVNASEHPNYDEERLAETMLKYAPLFVGQKAQELAIREEVGGAQTRHISQALAVLYNLRLSNKRKIDLKAPRR